MSQRTKMNRASRGPKLRARLTETQIQDRVLAATAQKLGDEQTQRNRRKAARRRAVG